jgi:hypothetical protein
MNEFLNWPKALGQLDQSPGSQLEYTSTFGVFLRL